MPYADSEKQKAYVREWSRDYYRRKKDDHDKLTERFEKTMAEYKETIEQQRIERNEVDNLKLDIKLALELFHKVHSIACDGSLSDSEAREQIINFQLNTPSYFREILNKLEQTKTEMEKNKK